MGSDEVVRRGLVEPADDAVSVARLGEPGLAGCDVFIGQLLRRKAGP